MKKTIATIATIAALFALTACNPNAVLQQLDDLPNPGAPTSPALIPEQYPNRPVRVITLSPAQQAWINTHPGVGMPNGPTVDPIPADAPNYASAEAS